ncbi:proteasome assembly chaperone 2, partial [Haematococcus lacustris]
MQLFSRAGATVNFRGATVLLVGEKQLGRAVYARLGALTGCALRRSHRWRQVTSAPRSGSRSATSLCPVATALEVYRVESEGGATPLYIIQQRAPAMAGRQAAAACALATLLKTEGVATAIVLCGLDSQLRRDQEIEGPEAKFDKADASSHTRLK